MYQQFFMDFPRRTCDNLLIIEDYCRQRQPEDPNGYEATQLINSLLGMLVFFKACRFHYPRKSLLDYSNVAEVGWLNQEQWGDEDWKDATPEFWLGNIVRHMRNALAHGKISPNENEQNHTVSSFVFTDCRKRADGKGDCIDYWTLTLTLEEIRAIAMDLVNAVPPAN